MKHTLLVFLTIALAAPVFSQSSPPTIDNARFAADPQHTFGTWGDITTLSNDRKKLTTTLPPDAAFDSNLNAAIDITYDPKVASWYPPVHYSPMSHADGAIQMSYQSNAVTGGVRGITLTANRDKLKALDAPRTYRFRFDPGPSAEMIWEIRPYEGPNYVANIGVSPGSPLPGDLVEFEITLSEPVTAPDGQQIAWRLVPANGFSEVRGGSDYASNELNWITIPQGQQLTRLVVRVSAKIDAGSTARIETWPEQEINTMAAPAYQSRTFRIGRPRTR